MRRGWKAALWRSLLVWAGAIAIGGAGYYAQAWYGCEFFGRSGALVVAYGVLLGFLSSQRTSEHGVVLDALQADQVRLAHLMHMRANAAPPELHAEIDDLIERKVAELDTTVSRLSADARNTWEMRVAELPIVVIGTFIWGFGDLALSGSGCAL